MTITKDWLTDEITFYDFIWEHGVEMCGMHVNAELMADFANGGSLFEEMREKMIQRFPTREDAVKAFQDFSAALDV